MDLFATHIPNHSCGILLILNLHFSTWIESLYWETNDSSEIYFLRVLLGSAYQRLVLWRNVVFSIETWITNMTCQVVSRQVINMLRAPYLNLANLLLHSRQIFLRIRTDKENGKHGDMILCFSRNDTGLDNAETREDWTAANRLSFILLK